jgi:hypothetical protein
MTLAIFLGGITMLNAFSVRWLESDETKIRYSTEFESQSWILKADILQDAIAMLEEKYDHVLNVEAFAWREKIKGENNATK